MSNVSKTIDIKDRIVSNQTHGVEDVTCGGSLNNPIHKLSKKIEKSIFQGLSISTPTENDRNFIYRDENDNVMVVDKTPGEAKYAWVRVTDVSKLNAGDKVIIVASSSTTEAYAMSTTQNTNNRGVSGVTKDEETGNYIDTIDDNIQEIKLGSGVTGWTLYCETGYTGYLYAAGGSGKNNYLKTKPENTDLTSEWKIEMLADNNILIQALDPNVNRKTIRFNNGGNPKIISCYQDTGQTPVQLYKWTNLSVPDVYKWKTLVSNDDIDVISKEELDEILTEPKCNPGNLKGECCQENDECNTTGYVCDNLGYRHKCDNN